MSSIAIIDYGMGNLRSVTKAVQRVTDQRVVVTYEPDIIRRADRVISPGVGAIRDCMAELIRLGLHEVIVEVARQKPLLGICLGMQALLSHSEENGGVAGLGIVPGDVVFFGEGLRDHAGAALKVPHMGWNAVQQSRVHPLWRNIPDGTHFYFVHSYYVRPRDPAATVGQCDYVQPFTAALVSDNVAAVQFHPEKSQQHGLQLLSNFVTWDGD
jgi:imidazole glycerol-phosphate synthase subunit HisH